MSAPATQSTNNYMVPASGGTHAVSFEDTYSDEPTLYDFRQFNLDNFPFVPQGCYCDNTQNDVPAVFTFAPMGISISVPANAFAVFNFPAPKGLQVNCMGNGDVTTVWVDYPVLPQIYYGGSTGTPVIVPGKPASNAGYQVQQLPASGFEAKHGRLSGATVSAALTPTNSSNLRKITLDLSADASLAAAGETTLTLTVNGNVIYQCALALPAAAGAGIAGWSKTIDFDTVAPQTAGAAVTVAVSTAFNTGGLDANAYFDA